MLVDIASEFNSLVEWDQPTLAGSGCELPSRVLRIISIVIVVVALINIAK